MKRLEEIIKNSAGPATTTSLVEDLRELGVSAGMTLAVHSSLSSLGYVVGGPVAVVLALEEALGLDGTLAMPVHSFDLSDPGAWQEPAVPEDWQETIRREMPAYRPDLTPTRKMGAIADCFRGQDSTVRSQHPLVSWVARGPKAIQITENHALAMGQGDESPLARLYELDASMLLLGVGYNLNTSFHLAEYRCKFAEQKRFQRGAPVVVGNSSEWKVFDDIYWYHGDFLELGAAFEEETPEVRSGQIGEAQNGGTTSKLFKIRAVVDFAVGWMNNNRSLS